MREPIDPGTSIGSVRLTVADLERATEFYEQALGLRTLDRSEGAVRLGADPGRPLVELDGAPSAPPAPARSTGLFHLAILVPNRAELARAVRRVMDAGWRFTGAADHLVSEALYLDDPEGNGIEVYRDRPREEWTYTGGELRMGTVALDLDGLIGQLPAGASDDGISAGTVMGHVHLRVADLAASEAFYSGVLGFEVTVRSYPGALFVSAGGYHHHIGMNTWAGEGAPRPPDRARGLRWFQVLLPDRALAQVSQRLAAAGVAAESRRQGLLVTDPAGNRLLLSAVPATVTPPRG